MTHDPNDVVKLYSGTLETAEAYREVLKDAGIDSRIVGASLTMVFGGAIPDTNELWVHRKDAESSIAAIENYEHGQGNERPHFAHPSSTPKPEAGPMRKEPYTNPDPAGE